AKGTGTQGPDVDLLLFSPKERWLAGILSPSHVEMIDLADLNLDAASLTTSGKDPALAFSADGDRLWSAGPTAPDDFWQLPSPTPQHAPRDRTRAPEIIAFQGSERVAAGTECQMDLKMIDLITGKVVWTITERAIPLNQPVFSQSGNRLAA